MSAAIPDHASLPVEELRRLLRITSAPECVICASPQLGEEINEHRGVYCYGCGDASSSSVEAVMLRWRFR